MSERACRCDPLTPLLHDCSYEALYQEVFGEDFKACDNPSVGYVAASFPPGGQRFNKFDNGKWQAWKGADVNDLR